MIKPYYDKDGITIYNADCRDVLPFIGRFDLCLTDPPYGFGSYATDNDHRDVLAGLFDIAPSVAIFAYPELLVEWCVFFGRVPNEWVTWFPTNKAVGRGSNLPRSSECIAIFGDVTGAKNVMRPRSQDSFGVKISIQRGLDPNWARENDVWCDPAPGVGSNSHLRKHPNEKPVSVLEKLITLCGNSNTVLDPFMGSGTTLVAAKQLGRSAVGIELEEKHCEVAANRLSQQEVMAF